MDSDKTLDFTLHEIIDDPEDLDDFQFVIDSNGELKSMIIPEHLMDNPPKQVVRILKLFGINDIRELNHRRMVH